MSVRSGLAAILVFLVFGALPSVARGQASPPADASWNPQLFHPNPGPDDFVTVEPARPLHHLSVAAGLHFDYARNPLDILTWSSRTQDPWGARIQAQTNVVGAHAWVGLGLMERWQLAISLPVTLFQTGESFDGEYPPPDGVHVRPPVGAAMGDPRVHLKVRIHGGERGVQIAFSHWLSVPVGTEGALAGAAHFTGFAGEPRLLGEWVGKRVRAGLSVGFQWRVATPAYYSAGAGQRLTYALAVAVDAAARLRLVGEIYGHHDFGEQVDYTAASPLEIDLAAKLGLGAGLSLTVGAGTRLIEGAGAPLVRAFAGLVFEQPRRDRDKDNIPDGLDRCPDVPEDHDGFQDSDGCPDLDNDRDNIPDTTDKCPNAPEDFDEFEDNDGCPEPDNDHDGRDDNIDLCPNAAEDKQPPAPDDGCPAGQGDEDADGIVGTADACPFLAEDQNGVFDDDGCPEGGATRVKIAGDAVELLEPLAFEGGAIAASSAAVVEDLAKLLAARPELRLRIEVFGDGGAEKKARALSLARADEVLAQLVVQGVAIERLVMEAKGGGSPEGPHVAIHLAPPAATPTVPAKAP